MWDSIEFVIRVLLALQLVFWGLNGFFHWIEIQSSGTVIDNFVQACISTRFVMPLVKSFEIVFGLLLLLNLYVSLSLLFLAPIIFVITALHLLHGPAPLKVLAPVTGPYVFLLIYHAQSYVPLLAELPGAV